jgi:hypothetical protein
VPDSGLTTLHRVVRLIMAIGAVAVVLCVVLTMVTLVASLGGAAATNLATTKKLPRLQAGPAGPHAPAASDLDPAPAREVTIDVYQGSGSAVRGPFQLPRPGRIGLAWSYACPAHHAGDFVLGQTGPAASGVVVRSTGRTDRGISRIGAAGGWHVLVIVSDCRWTIRVARPASR